MSGEKNGLGQFGEFTLIEFFDVNFAFPIIVLIPNFSNAFGVSCVCR